MSIRCNVMLSQIYLSLLETHSKYSKSGEYGRVRSLYIAVEKESYSK